MKIKVLSFNIRMDNTNDGDNYLPNRFGRIKEMLDAESPDIIGFQETREMARKWLSDTLSEYTVLSAGRCEGYRGEGLSIAFKKELFDLFSLDTFWLSDRPYIPNSTYGGDQSPCPRIAQLAVLVPRDNKCSAFSFCNVHLDHMGKDARMLGAMQILQKLFAIDKKFVIVGDFNARPDDNSVGVIKNSGTKCIRDLTEDIPSTFHGWGRREGDAKIDYIFTDFENYEKGRLIDDPHPEGIYYSDHYAVSAVIDI